MVWSVNEAIRTRSSRDDSDEDDLVPAASTAHPVLIESIKLALSVGFYLWQRRGSRFYVALSRSLHSNGHGVAPTEEGVPLNGLSGHEDDDDGEEYHWQRPEKRVESRVPPSITIILTLLTAVLFTYSGHVVSTPRCC